MVSLAGASAGGSRLETSKGYGRCTHSRARAPAPQTLTRVRPHRHLRRFSKHLAEDSYGHDRAQYSVIVILAHIQAIEEGFHVGVTSWASHRSFSAVEHGQKHVDFVGDAARIVGAVCPSFGSQMQRTCTQR